MDYFYSYFSFLKKFYSPNPDKKLKVVFDCLNNPTSIILKHLFQKEIAEKRFTLINADFKKPPRFFNPLEKKATDNLRAAVRRFKADLGIIFDADADRLFCLDDKSRFVEPEAVARLLIWRLKPKKIIIDAVSGWLIKKIRNQKSEIRIIESEVGQFFIKQKMRVQNADFGAEHSGHYYFKEFFGLDSGILAAIEVINAVSRLPYKLSDFVELLPKYYRQEINIRRQESETKIREFLKKVEDYYKPQTANRKLLKISRLDGLTMEFGNKIGLASHSLALPSETLREGRGEGWWLNLRFSNTEPLLRLNIEAESQSELKKQVSILANFIEANQLN